MTQHNILVIGAAGKSGTPVVVQGLTRGHSVTAFVRHPEKAAHLPGNAKIVQGDGLDAAAVKAAAAGHDVVIITVGDRSSFVSGPVTRNAVAAMQAAGTKRLMLLSAYGIGDSAHGIHGFVLSKVLSKLNADKMAAEAALAGSGLDWTAVRPPVLGDGPARGDLKAAEDVRINGFQSISRQDLAAFMLDEMDARAFVGKKPILFRG